jgi:hypothetical protein
MPGHDMVDIVESKDPDQIARAALLIRGYSHATTSPRFEVRNPVHQIDDIRVVIMRDLRFPHNLRNGYSNRGASRRCSMAMYVILSKLSPDAFEDPKDFKKLAWVSSFAYGWMAEVTWERGFLGISVAEIRGGRTGWLVLPSADLALADADLLPNSLAAAPVYSVAWYSAGLGCAGVVFAVSVASFFGARFTCHLLIKICARLAYMQNRPRRPLFHAKSLGADPTTINSLMIGSELLATDNLIA